MRLARQTPCLPKLQHEPVCCGVQGGVLTLRRRQCYRPLHGAPPAQGAASAAATITVAARPAAWPAEGLAPTTCSSPLRAANAQHSPTYHTLSRAMCAQWPTPLSFPNTFLPQHTCTGKSSSAVNRHVDGLACLLCSSAVRHAVDECSGNSWCTSTWACIWGTTETGYARCCYHAHGTHVSLSCRRRLGVPAVLFSRAPRS